MPNKKQVSLRSGYTYHIYNKGNNNECIFREPRNYDFFLQKYWKYIAPVADIFAYVLIPNHFHFMCRFKPYHDLHQAFPKRFPNPPTNISVADEVYTFEEMEYDKLISKRISKQFSDFFNCYAQSFNKAYNRPGKLFLENFKRIQVMDECYFTYLICYIHRNAIHHGLCENFLDWPNSSIHDFISAPSGLVDVDFIIDWFGSLDSFREIHLRAKLDWMERRFLLE